VSLPKWTNSRFGSTPTVVKTFRVTELKNVSASSRSPWPLMSHAYSRFIDDQRSGERCEGPKTSSRAATTRFTTFV